MTLPIEQPPRTVADLVRWALHTVSGAGRLAVEIVKVGTAPLVVRLVVAALLPLAVLVSVLARVVGALVVGAVRRLNHAARRAWCKQVGCRRVILAAAPVRGYRSTSRTVRVEQCARCGEAGVRLVDGRRRGSR